MVISHPLGRNFVSRLKAVDATVVPHDLPERDELDRLVQVRCGFPSMKRVYLLINNKFHIYSIYILQVRPDLMRDRKRLSKTKNGVFRFRSAFSISHKIGPKTYLQFFQVLISQSQKSMWALTPLCPFARNKTKPNETKVPAVSRGVLRVQPRPLSGDPSKDAVSSVGSRELPSRRGESFRYALMPASTRARFVSFDGGVFQLPRNLFAKGREADRSITCLF